MRSIKLSGLIRRNSDRPSLKQRAAALKATAAKVMRRPPAAAADPFEGKPTPEGFVPYPFDAPEAWLNIRGALREEGERLLQIALGELSRRMDAYRASRFSEDEARAHETRLRCELRIDALMTLSGRMDSSDRSLPEPGSEEAMPAQEVPESAAVADAVLAAIAASRAAEAEMTAWQRQASARPGDLTEAMFAEEHQLCIVQSRTRDVALSTVPTTLAGRLALVEYVRFVMDLYGMGEDDEGADNLHMWKQTHTTLMAALSAPIGSPASLNHDLVMAQGLYAKSLDLSGISFNNLTLLYEQFYHVADALLTISNDDGFWDDQKNDYTPGGRLLDVESNRLGCLRDAIADELERRRPVKTSDRDGRLLALVMQEMRCEGRICDRALLAEINAAWGA